MDGAARTKCMSAIAHLKIAIPKHGCDNLVHVPEQDAPVARSLGHDLLEMYVVDEGDRFNYVQERDLLDAQVTANQLREKALRNLGEVGQRKIKVRPYGALYTVLGGSNHEASMLLLDAFWDEWYKRLAPNGFVVAFPARDILSFADAGSAAGIDELRSLISRGVGKLDHPLSDRLYRRQDHEWIPFLES